MFGLDQSIAHASDGRTLLIVLLVAAILGLRHASDPDHLAAVTTLVAGRGAGSARRAARLGLTWGLGHATSLFVFGVPIVLYRAYLPEAVQSTAETAVGFLIVGLAVWLLIRWRRGAFLVHEHEPERRPHVHVHAHTHARPHAGRTPLQAYAIGLVHGMGGSAGVGVLLLASIQDRTLALGSLALFAVCTAVSMAALSTGFGLTLGTRRVRRSFHVLAPSLGLVSLAFGVWYALGAQGVVPYVF
jgi:ABC-type nickel/cobalt efflux system permease component RcnA